MLFINTLSYTVLNSFKQNLETWLLAYKYRHRLGEIIMNLETSNKNYVPRLITMDCFLENSSRNFSEIFSFRVVTQAVLLENSSNFEFSSKTVSEISQ